jgi:hypothetical protein
MFALGGWRRVLGLAAAGALGVIACGPETGESDEFDTEIDACTQCQRILVECTSSAENEAQFVECRDQWMSCQHGRSVGKECRNPSDEKACTLCRERLAECKGGGDAATCDAEFSVCKAFLMTRGDVARRCTADAAPAPEVACGVCQKDYALCVSEVEGETSPDTCSTKFGQCMEANALGQGQCAIPSGSDGCELCNEHHQDCVAAGSSDCDARFDACTTSIASGVTCEPSSGEGGAGGSSSTSTSGSGGGTAACSHDVCEYGAPLDYGCEPCVAAVCDEDPFCCDMLEGQWDYYCTDSAAIHCGCSI